MKYRVFQICIGFLCIGFLICSKKYRVKKYRVFHGFIGFLENASFLDEDYFLISHTKHQPYHDTRTIRYNENSYLGTKFARPIPSSIFIACVNLTYTLLFTHMIARVLSILDGFFVIHLSPIHKQWFFEIFLRTPLVLKKK